MFLPIVHIMVRMPMPMLRVVLVQFFSWSGFYCFFIYTTDWVGTAIYEGDPMANQSTESFLLYTEG